MFSFCGVGSSDSAILYAHRRTVWRALFCSRGMFYESRAGAQAHAFHNVCIGADCGCVVNSCVSFFIVRWYARVDRIGISQKKDTPSAGAGFFFRAGAGSFRSSSVNRHSCCRGVATAKGVSSLLEAADACFARQLAQDSLTKSSGGPVNISYSAREARLCPNNSSLPTIKRTRCAWQLR